MSKDKNFDQHKERFRRNIYDTPKGEIRLKIIQHIYDSYLDQLQQPSLTVLDLGCGMGQVAANIAARGHAVTLCDHSQEMIAQAKTLFNERGLEASFVHQDLQGFCEQDNVQYDLIICHAVLEWLHQPELLISQVKSRLKPGGCLSLMFYNVNALIWFNLLKGNFRKVMSDDFQGHPGGLTPTNPIKPEDVDRWLQQAGFETGQITGVRVLYDYLSRDLRQSRSLEDIMELELRFCEQAPFNMMGRYLHYLCYRPS